MLLHLRYTSREASHLQDPATQAVKEVLDEPDRLFQLFCLNNDFGNSWPRSTDTLSITVDQDRFPYWVKRLGMDDQLVASFAVVDWVRGKLTAALATVECPVDAQAGGRAITIDQGSPVFAFLQKYRDSKVYMAVSYKMS